MYTVYKTICLINNKFYIGVHKTNNPQDDYLGSGNLIRRSIEKHGKENFRKEILLITEDREEAFDKEKELVNPEDPLSYNLKKGGEGGFDYINKNSLNPKLENLKTGMFGKKHSKETKKKLSLRFSGINNPNFGSDRSGKNNSMFGKKHSKETKKKLSLFHKGSNNSQYGTMWITNGVETKKIKKTESIPEGWYRGRTNLSQNINM